MTAIPMKVPVLLISVLVPQPPNPDADTNWPEPGYFSVKITEDTVGLIKLARLHYGDTYDTNIDGSSARGALVITPLAPGSPLPKTITLTMTAEVVAPTDRVTFTLIYKGKNADGKPIYAISFEAWDMNHQNNYFTVSGTADMKYSAVTIKAPTPNPA